MSLKKKDLEIIYSLKWKNKPKGEDKELSIIAVYDIPATTLNFEVFKSYLLKNSGTSENDVKVSYIMDNGKEFPIQSQVDFQVALYSFRGKARYGEIINLLLERISDGPTHKNLRHSNDVETQFNTIEPVSLQSNCNMENPPDWFLNGISQLKKELTDEITAAVSSVVSATVANLKPQQLPSTVIPPHYIHPHVRKFKPEKRPKKSMAAVVENTFDVRDLRKFAKIDVKLEKLERKATKYREKRQVLQKVIKPTSEPGPSNCARSTPPKGDHDMPKEQDLKMDAQPVNVQKVYPHMLGGETYLHQWEVQNTGEAPWTHETQLQFAWGSMEPMEKIIPLPLLKPGQKGTVAARIRIPAVAGKYECYWHFKHGNRRFGQWLGCKVMVDPFDLKGKGSVLETSQKTGLQATSTFKVSLNKHAIGFEKFAQKSSSPDASQSQSEPGTVQAESFSICPLDDPQGFSVRNITEELLCKVAENVEQHLNIDDKDTSDSNSSDDDNLSLLEGYASSKNSLKDEFVLVPVPQCFIVDGDNVPVTQATAEPGSSSGKKGSLREDGSFDDNNNENAGSSSGSIKLRDEDLDNVVVITVPKDAQVKEGYIYVYIDGEKVLVPKNILKSEVVDAAKALESQPGEEAVGVSIESNKTVTAPQEVDDNIGNTTDSAPCLQPTTIHSSAEDVPIVQLWPISLEPNAHTDPRNDYFETNNYTSHCSAAGSCYSDMNASSNRMFVFPQSVPGYEVVYPALDLSNPNVVPEMPAAQVPQQSPQSHNPFNDSEHTPNFQQTPPEERPVAGEVPPFARPVEHNAVPIHILPETLVNGAVNAASSAINTARSVINRIKPQAPGTWINGHWVSASPQTPREANLQALAEMGFWNRDLNATLLARYNDDLNRVITELVQ